MSLNDYLKCPGPERSMKALPEIYPCPDCGAEVELWSDEKKTRCSRCGGLILKPKPQHPPRAGADGFEKILQLACSMGASEAKIISSRAIVIEDELANHCLAPRCENYGLTRNCPPHVSGPQGFREIQKTHGQALVLRIAVPASDLFSEQRREIFGLLQEVVAATEMAAAGMGYANSKGFAGGSCRQIFCRDQAECRILSGKGDCRHPQLARPSMSGFGIHVGRLIKACGWPADIAASGSGAMSWVAGLVMIG